MAEYPILSVDNARNFLNMSSEEISQHGESLVEYRGEKDQFDGSFIPSLRSTLEKVAKQVAIDTPTNRVGGKFEATACEHVHIAFSNVAPEAIADSEFWLWVTIVNFADLVEWRFNTGGSRAKLSNYGIGNPKEGLMYRMWLRGELGFCKSETNPYALAKVGDQDLWRSHIIRQGYGNVRALNHALLRLQSGKLGHPSLGVEKIRSLAKEVKRLRANVFLEALSQSEAEALIVELAKNQ